MEQICSHWSGRVCSLVRQLHVCCPVTKEFKKIQEWKLLQRKLNKVFAGANVVSRLETTKTITGFFFG